MSKLIRLSFNVDGESNFQRILVLPITDDESKKIVSDSGCNAEDSFNPLYEKIANESSKQMMDFVFALSNTPIDLIVSDNETEEEIYSDDEFTIEPTYGVMSMDEINENYPDDDDKETKEEQEKYLKGTMHDSNGLYISEGFSKAWEGLINNTVSCSSFVPAVIKESLKTSGAKSALLAGESEVCSSTITFKIELKDGEEFDVDKLEFINFDESYDDYSHVLNKLLENDMVSMNAIIYDGKMYFAGHNDFDCDENNGDSYYDFVNEDIESETPNIKIDVPLKKEKYKNSEEWPKEAHEFLQKLIEKKGFCSLYNEDIELIRKFAIKYEINPDEFQFEAESLWKKAEKNRDKERQIKSKNREIEEFLEDFRIQYSKYSKGYAANNYEKCLIKAKTIYKDNPVVQATLKEMEALTINKATEKVDEEYYRKQKEIELNQAELKAEAEAIRTKKQMLKDEAEYHALKKEKEERDAIEREERLAKARKQQEENLRQLKEHWPIIKKVLIAFAVLLIITFVLLLLFGPNSK